MLNNMDYRVIRKQGGYVMSNKTIGEMMSSLRKRNNTKWFSRKNECNIQNSYANCNLYEQVVFENYLLLWYKLVKQID